MAEYQPFTTVYHRQAPPDLSSWSDATQVSAPGELASRPAGIFHDDILRVAYELDLGGGSPKDVVLARQEGSIFVFEVLSRSFNSGALWPRPHSVAGRFWVDWIDATTGDEFHGEMAWLRQDGLEEWEVNRYEPFDGQEERDYFVRGTIRHQALSLP